MNYYVLQDLRLLFQDEPAAPEEIPDDEAHPTVDDSTPPNTRNLLLHIYFIIVRVELLYELICPTFTQSVTHVLTSVTRLLK